MFKEQDIFKEDYALYVDVIMSKISEFLDVVKQYDLKADRSIQDKNEDTASFRVYGDVLSVQECVKNWNNSCRKPENYHRIKSIFIGESTFRQLISGNYVLSFEGIPEDAKCLGMYHEVYRRGFIITYEHESFSPISIACNPPVEEGFLKTVEYRYNELAKNFRLDTNRVI
jgi:hypothetical protein